MATRRDQLQSYQFLTQRVISAFVMRETDPAQSPLRRGIGAVFAGVMISILVAAGFGVYGILNHVGGNNWATDGSVIVERETGATFVYAGGQVHPTLNLASALLIAGRPNPAVFRVAGDSLRGVPRTAMVGIRDAPDSLPGPDQRVTLPWLACVVPDSDASGAPTRSVLLGVGVAAAGGRSLGDGALLVRDSTGSSTYLIWHGYRYRFQETQKLVPGLFGAVAAPILAGPAWLSTLPSGKDIGPITVTDRGTPSAAVANRKIGDVLVAPTGTGTQYYLVLADGLAPITPLQQAILAAVAPATPTNAGSSEATTAKRSSRVFVSSGELEPPPTVPTLLQPAASESVCAQTIDASAAPTISVDSTVDGLAHAIAVAPSKGSVRLADRVLVPAGRIAVIRVLGAPTSDSGAFSIVTDLGIRFPVPDQDVLRMLGYAPEQAVDVPASLVSRLPVGPTLDPAAAAKPVAGAA